MMSRKKSKHIPIIHNVLSVLDFLEHTPTCGNSEIMRKKSYTIYFHKPTTRCQVRQLIKGRVGSSNPLFPDAERSGG